MWPQSGQARAVLVVGATAFASMYLLLSAGPAMVAQTAGSFGAGLVTTVFMVVTICAQFATPLSLRRVPPAPLLLLSLLFLSVPSLVYAVAEQPWILVGAAGLRGVGFGVMTIVCTTLVSLYAVPGRQGGALGVYGLATSVTGIVAPSLGIWMLDRWGGVAVAVAAFVIPLAGVLYLGSIRRATPAPVTPKKSAVQPRGESPWTWARFAPIAIFVPVAMAYGGSYTFLPLFSETVVLSLLLLGVGFAVGRVVGGRLVDRTMSAWVTAVFAVIGALGLVLVAWMPTAALASLASVILGFGVGGTASASLAGMMASVPPSQYGFVSTAWNLSFDLGIALGGLGLGLIINSTGFSGGITVLATVMAVMVMLLFVPLTRLTRYVSNET